MDIHAYLQRINYHGALHPFAQTLRDLHLAHLLTVPFENLSVHYKEQIVLQEKALFDKVVKRQRGGFCYELNGLFCALLRALGFKVEMLAAGVARGNGDFGPRFDHMMLMVTLNERWLVDVGFGEGFRQPLRLDDRSVQRQDGRAYQLLADGQHLVLMQQKKNEEWKPQYRFDLQIYNLKNYETMCHYHQTSPLSSFTKGRICTRATPEGRLTLSKMRFITTALEGERQEREVADENEYAILLDRYFGILLR